MFRVGDYVTSKFNSQCYYIIDDIGMNIHGEEYLKLVAYNKRDNELISRHRIPLERGQKILSYYRIKITKLSKKLYPSAKIVDKNWMIPQKEKV